MIGERYRLVAELGSGGYGRVWKARDTVLAGPLSADDAVRLAVGMLRALQAAEQSGIVHRDVKPANVMMTVAGEILLTDFGIAVNLEDPCGRESPWRGRVPIIRCPVRRRCRRSPWGRRRRPAGRGRGR